MERRIFFSNNSTLTDLSDKLQNPATYSVVMPYLSATDYVYFGTYLPFNHLFWMFEVPNTETVSLSVDFWSDSQWRPVIDLFDMTEGLSRDEYVRWSIPKDYAWPREPYSYDVTGLESTEVYGLYWLRVSASADLTALTEVKYIGQKYSNDSDLYGYYPDLMQQKLKLQFGSGKTNWDDQAVSAAENIILHLKTKHVIKTADQILNPAALKLASIHKTAEIIYGAFGQGYRDDKIQAAKSFNEAINQSFYQVDANANARLDGYDRSQSVRWLSR